MIFTGKLHDTLAATKLGNMATRTISGALFVALTVACVLFGPYSFLLLFGVYMTGCLFEYYTLTGINRSPQRILGVLIGVGVYTSVALGLMGQLDFRYLLFLPILILFGILTATFSGAHSPFSDFGKMLAGLVYAGFPFVALGFVGMDAETGTYDPFPVLLFLVLVWANDTFAYLSGRFMGRTRLAKNISPGKTWEGTIGGLVGSLLPAVGASQVFPGRSLETVLVIWFAASVLAVVGDLSESKLKRVAGVKDSGRFMPGHGGFLDRFDSLLLSAPFLMVYFLLVKA